MSVSTKAPSGFRDFIGAEARRRRLLAQGIASVYESYGFGEIETPALENLEVLLGSGGQENEKLLFRILKRKEKLEKSFADLKEESEFSKIETQLSDLGLRFDLTVPLCRLVAEYQNDIKLPWKVFHIAPVWRAERAQRGRFREFFQCDVDIIGAEGVGAELEILQAVSSAFEKIGVKDLVLQINHRKLIEIFSRKFGVENHIDQFAIILDKKDKLPKDKLMEEMKSILPTKEVPSLLVDLIEGNLNRQKVGELDAALAKQIFELEEMCSRVPLPVKDIVFEPSLVRGMGYYTGFVFEMRHDREGYALAGGGRYDHLIGRFSKRALPAVGMSIGFERLLLLLGENEKAQTEDDVFFMSVIEEGRRSDCLKLAKELRDQGLKIDVYPDKAKAQKQMKYAASKSYRWVLIVGSKELESREIRVKDFKTGEEASFKQGQLSEHLRKCLDS